MKPNRNKPYRPWAEDGRKALLYFFMACISLTVIALLKEHDPQGYLFAFGVAAAAVFILVGLKRFKSAFFRFKGKWVEKTAYRRLKFCSPFWRVKSSVMLPKPFRSDADIVVYCRRKTVCVEVKSAQTDWGLRYEEMYRWNAKAMKAVAQAQKIGKAMRAPSVLWLPESNYKMAAYRNGVLVVCGGVWALKRAIRKNLL